MKIEIDFPFHGYTKGELIEFCFGKGASVDNALPLDLIKEIQRFTNSLNGHYWYVMDYTENKVAGRLVNLKAKFFDKVAEMYMANLPKTLKEARVIEPEKFTFKLSHDKGEFILSTYAYSEEDAKKAIMDFEGCPRCAMERIRA